LSLSANPLILQPVPGSVSDHEGSEGELVTTVYHELRKLAAARMAREYGPQTLQATALVHEAWLRIGGEDQPQWANRAQFFAAAAEAMRRILVERARRRQAARHGGGLQRVEADALNWENIDGATAEANDNEIIVLNEALEKLALSDRDSAELVKLHYFAGLKIGEAARTMGIAGRTAERRLAYAKAWLGREIEHGSSA
jgi:RNA polymerase sigma factor (TIGR02999 family)